MITEYQLDARLAEVFKRLEDRFIRSENTQVLKVEGLEGRLEDFEEATRGQILTARQLSAERGQRLDDAMANAGDYRDRLVGIHSALDERIEALEEVVGTLLDERNAEAPLEPLPVRSFWEQFRGWG